MSTYSGRHGPNVSHYLRELNAISPQDTSPTAEEAFNLEEDLALFTNTQFYDFDSGQNTDFQAHPVKADVDNASQHTTTSTSGEATPTQTAVGDITSLDFMSEELNFADLGNAFAGNHMNGFAEAAQGFQAFQPSHNQNAIQIPHQQPQFRQGNGRAGDKRKAVDVTVTATSTAAPTPIPVVQQMNFEETSRVAAEEDKRRRNTAASARFRIKKKQREQALEKSAKEMTEKVTSLENRISQLETENKWLKNLLVEKNGNEDIAKMLKEFTKHASERTKAKAPAAESPNKDAAEPATNER